jgi:hypothetical protein
MSTLSLKNVKIQDPTGTLVSTLSYDGTNVTIDKPVLVPTAPAGTNSTQAATTAMVHSAITNDLNVTGSAPMYACRAWINFDGTVSSPIPRASGNISSITKNGTDDYKVSFMTAMPDANYAVSGSVGLSSTGYASVPEFGTTKTTTSCSVMTPTIVSISGDNRASTADSANIHLTIFR